MSCMFPLLLWSGKLSPNMAATGSISLLAEQNSLQLQLNVWVEYHLNHTKMSSRVNEGELNYQQCYIHDLRIGTDDTGTLVHAKCWVCMQMSNKPHALHITWTWIESVDNWKTGHGVHPFWNLITLSSSHSAKEVVLSSQNPMFILASAAYLSVSTQCCCLGGKPATLWRGQMTLIF